MKKRRSHEYGRVWNWVIRISAVVGGMLLFGLVGMEPSASNRETKGRRTLNIKKKKPSVVTDKQLFRDMMKRHYYKIFPKGERNVGGPQFFKYIHDTLATSHDLFVRYNRFYCGVSGSIVPPDGRGNYSVAKIRDANGKCIVGKYYRCCWPCACDIMKFARAEKVKVVLPKDPTKTAKTYTFLTIGDPCHRCRGMPCPALPKEVRGYRCKNYAMANGLRVKNGRVTTKRGGRLVFAILYDAKPMVKSKAKVSKMLMKMCASRTNADIKKLTRMGGMGDIFVKLALINNKRKYSNSKADLCQ